MTVNTISKLEPAKIGYKKVDRIPVTKNWDLFTKTRKPENNAT